MKEYFCFCFVLFLKKQEWPQAQVKYSSALPLELGLRLAHCCSGVWGSLYGRSRRGSSGFGHTVTLGPAVVHLPAVWKIQVSKRCSSQVFKLETARPVEMKCVCVRGVCVCVRVRVPCWRGQPWVPEPCPFSPHGSPSGVKIVSVTIHCILGIWRKEC